MEAADEQLMLAYAGGDAAAFQALYGRHRGPLYRFMLRSLKERALAEELFQEVWMRVIDARERYQPQARFKTWLYTIAHHRVVDHWREKGLSLVALEPQDAVADHAADPERRVAARQSARRLLAALEALPPVQREAFLLHEEAGLGVAEIAEATGCDFEAAKSRLRYAVAKLKAALADD